MYYSNGEGQVLIRGRYLFMGYLRNPEKTAEVMNPNGCYQTGDIGSIDSEGNTCFYHESAEILSGQNCSKSLT